MHVTVFLSHYYTFQNCKVYIIHWNTRYRYKHQNYMTGKQQNNYTSCTYNQFIVHENLKFYCSYWSQIQITAVFLSAAMRKINLTIAWYHQWISASHTSHKSLVYFQVHTASTTSWCHTLSQDIQQEPAFYILYQPVKEITLYHTTDIKFKCN